MPKVGKAWVGRNNTSKEYEIYYSSKHEIFYVKIGSLGEDAQIIFNAIMSKKSSERELKGLASIRLRGDIDSLITADTEADVKERTQEFWNSLVTQTVKDEKVVLYKFEYSTGKQSTDRFHHHDIETGKLNLEFRYIVAIKRSFSNNVVYLKENNLNSQLHNSDYFQRLEIPWSEELQIFLDDFSGSFDRLVDHMKLYFSEEGKILELMGKNILSN